MVTTKIWYYDADENNIAGAGVHPEPHFRRGALLQRARLREAARHAAGTFCVALGAQCSRVQRTRAVDGRLGAMGNARPVAFSAAKGA